MDCQNHESMEADWLALMSIFQLLAERGRRIRLAQKETTVDNAPLAGNKSTAVDQQPAQNADAF